MEETMPDSVYKVVEVVGTSNESISKAIDRAISKVTVKVGFTLEE
jgi:Dodecin